MVVYKLKNQKVPCEHWKSSIKTTKSVIAGVGYYTDRILVLEYIKFESLNMHDIRINLNSLMTSIMHEG